MDPNRKYWNSQQQMLRQALEKPGSHEHAIRLFLDQHAMLHSAPVSESGLHSFEDEVWEGLDEQGFRTIPPKEEHSIAWIFWHLTRIEDITMNRLVAGCPQIYDQEGWAERSGATVCDTASAMDEAAVAALSRSLDMQALRDYRTAVGRATRHIASQLQPGDFKKRVDPERIRQVQEERRRGAGGGLAAGILGRADGGRLAADASHPAHLCAPERSTKNQEDLFKKNFLK
jgi:hypothetical protein